MRGATVDDTSRTMLLGLTGTATRELVLSGRYVERLPQQALSAAIGYDVRRRGHSRYR